MGRHTKEDFVYRHVNVQSPTTAYVDNNVTTTKYTRYNFIGKNLLEQFGRIANQYFLVVSVFASLPISPKDHISLIGTKPGEERSDEPFEHPQGPPGTL